MVVVEAIEVNETDDCSAAKARGSATRTSARIQKIKSTQDAIRRRQREEEAITKAEKPVKKQRVKYNKQKSVVASVLPSVLPEVVEKKLIAGVENVEEVKDGEKKEIVVLSASKKPVGEKSAYSTVTDTVRAFYKHFLYYVQEEEKRCKKDEDDKKKPKSKEEEKKRKKDQAEEKKRKKDEDDKKKPKSKTQDEVGGRRQHKRPDLKALSSMLTSNNVYTPPSRIGSIPGVDVGHQFFSRCEMVTVGFHNHWLSGIDYIGASFQQEYPNYKLPLTVAIVMSGQYEDDLDNSEDVVYTGQGGNNLLGNKRQIGDQEMKRGNLGLKNSLDQNVPVRVIRGHQSTTSYVGKVYTYDGLYKVDKYWAEKGVSGYTVYKFRLKRMEGQPSLVTEQVYFARGRIPDKVSELRGLVCEDISGGLENIPIPATNLVDDPPVPPTGKLSCT
ncbi:putative [histone H3]-lysine(4) N-trimethyltransferase [Helianthus debilis subsp. tardiflorus]